MVDGVVVVVLFPRFRGHFGVTFAFGVVVLPILGGATVVGIGVEVVAFMVVVSVTVRVVVANVALTVVVGSVVLVTSASVVVGGLATSIFTAPPTVSTSRTNTLFIEIQLQICQSP